MNDVYTCMYGGVEIYWELFMMIIDKSMNVGARVKKIKNFLIVNQIKVTKNDIDKYF